MRKVDIAVVRFTWAHPQLQRTEFQDGWWLVVVVVEHRMPGLFGEYIHVFEVLEANASGAQLQVGVSRIHAGVRAELALSLHIIHLDSYDITQLVTN